MDRHAVRRRHRRRSRTPRRRLHPARAVHIVNEIAEALDHAHRRGVVHHDVKPSNLLLSDEDHVLLTDFGVARALEHPEAAADDGALVATLAYAAPEVITGDDVGARADVYSLGCTLFRLLTGKQPFFDADGTTALIRAHLRRPPPRISDHLSGGSPQLDWVITTALAKDPADRFASARQLARAAAAALPSATPPSAAAFERFWSQPYSRHTPIAITTPATRPNVQRPCAIGAAALGVVTIVVAAVAVLSRNSDSTPSGEATPPPSSSTASTVTPATVVGPVPRLRSPAAPTSTPAGG